MQSLFTDLPTLMNHAIAFIPDKPLIIVQTNGKGQFKIKDDSYEPGFPNVIMSILVNLKYPNSVYCGEILTRKSRKTGKEENVRAVVNGTQDKSVCSKVTQYLQFLEDNR